ncbi:ABC transporter permease family protein [Streptomyces peucetius]
MQNEVTASGHLVGDLSSYAEQQRTSGLIKYSMIVFAAAPLLALFPFLQKYFVKGLTLGAVKS